MRNLIAIAALMTGLSGCIIYDDGCYDESSDCDFWGDNDGLSEWDTAFDEEQDGEDNEEDGEDDATPVELSFFPAQAEQGELFPAIIKLEAGDLDLSQVTAFRLYGDVNSLSSVVREDSITVILEIPADAQLGPVDVVLEFGPDKAELMPGALTIYPAGSGNSGTDWTDGAADGSDDCE